MNDAKPSGGLHQKFEEVLDAAADQAIDEFPDSEFRPSMGDAHARARDIATTLGGRDVRQPKQASTFVHANMMQEAVPEKVDPDAASMRDRLNQVGATPDWSVTRTIEQRIGSSQGSFKNLLFDNYVDRMPFILSGQELISGCLWGSLEIASTAFDRAQIDAEKLAQSAIDVLEADGGGGDPATALSIISGALGVASGILAFIPGAQGISAGLGLASGLIGFEETIRTSAGEEDKKPVITGQSVDTVIDSLVKGLWDIKSSVEGVESAAGAVLREVNTKATDTTSMLNTDVSTTLTMHDGWFRPRPLSGGGAGTPGSADTSPLVVINKSDLGEVAAKFGVLASAYGANASHAGAMDSGLETAFTRHAGREGYAAFPGPLYPSWTTLHATFQQLLSESGTNLSAVSAAVTTAITDFDGVDAANASNVAQALPG